MACRTMIGIFKTTTFVRSPNAHTVALSTQRRLEVSAVGSSVLKHQKQLVCGRPGAYSKERLKADQTALALVCGMKWTP